MEEDIRDEGFGPTTCSASRKDPALRKGLVDEGEERKSAADAKSEALLESSALEGEVSAVWKEESEPVSTPSDESNGTELASMNESEAPSGVLVGSDSNSPSALSPDDGNDESMVMLDGSPGASTGMRTLVASEFPGTTNACAGTDPEDKGKAGRS